MNKITSARITAQPKDWTDPMPRVYVTTENEQGEPEEFFLFEYYPDEIAFDPSEFVGLDMEQACSLKISKDVAYLLQS